MIIVAEEIIDMLVEGGKASPGPETAPKFAALKMNMGQVFDAVNEKTKGFVGMKVPVKVTVDKTTKEYKIEVGVPPVSQLLKKESGIAKGAGKHSEETVGDISFDKVAEVSRMKFGDAKKGHVKQVVGSALSMGLTIEGKSPKDIGNEIDEGKWDGKLE